VSGAATDDEGAADQQPDRDPEQELVCPDSALQEQ
jgi:hypothetical protein